MDGASVVGLIAATIELAGFTKNVVQRLKSFVEATEDVPRALQVLHRRLPILLLNLQAIQEQINRNQLPSSEVSEIADVVKPCREELANLKEQLQDLLPDSSDSSFVKSKKALKSLKADSKIQKSVEVVGLYLSDLASYNSARATLKNDQKTDRILELSVQTHSATSQLQQTVVALASKPSFLRDKLEGKSYEECQGLVIQKTKASLLPPQRHARLIQDGGGSLADKCTCWNMKSKTLSRRNHNMWNAAISHEICNPHLPNCPLHCDSRDSKQTSICLEFPRFLLQRAVNLTWTCKYGAGGFSMSSYLHLKGVVRIDSPVSDLIEECFGYTYLPRPSYDFEGFRIKLVRLFQDGKASPTELNAEGQSIAFACLVTSIYGGSISSVSEWMLLLKDLWLLGVPINERCEKRCFTSRGDFASYTSMTSLDLVAFDPRFVEFTPSLDKDLDPYIYLTSLIDSGAQISSSSNLVFNLYRTRLMTHIPEHAELSNCSKLHMAILARSQHDVRSIVRADPDRLRERTVGGLQALHLAVEWPEGTKLLLDLGANPGDGDDMGYPPAFYAVYWLCLETVERLLAARGPLSFEARTENEQRPTIQDLMYFALQLPEETVYAQIIHTLATRRKELASYVQKHLPKQVLQELHVDQHTVSDLETMEIFRCLQDHGHSIDRHYFGLTEHSVYGVYSGGNHRRMQIAFDAGFRNIDRPMVKGRVLLQILCSDEDEMYFGGYWALESFLWWNEKGVDLTRPIICPDLRNNEMLIIHRLSMELVGSWKFTYSGVHDLWRRALQILLAPEHMSCKDSCRCLCAFGGCTPLTNLLKAASRRYGLIWLPSSSVIESLFERIIEPNGTMSALENKDDITSAMIRLLLFDSLGLRHLCCQFDRYKYGFIPALEKDEAEEIMEEDRYLVEEFHALLPRAIEGWRQSTLPLWDFWLEFYEQHIRPKRENNDQEYVKAVEDLGVRIEEI